MEHKSYLANKKKLKEVKEDYMETLEDNQYLDEDNISNLDLPMPYFEGKLNFCQRSSTLPWQRNTVTEVKRAIIQKIQK